MELTNHTEAGGDPPPAATPETRHIHDNTTQHNPVGWRNWLQEVRDTTGPHEISETIYDYLCGGGAGPNYRELDQNIRVRIWRDERHRCYAQRTKCNTGAST